MAVETGWRQVGSGHGGQHHGQLHGQLLPAGSPRDLGGSHRLEQASGHGYPYEELLGKGLSWPWQRVAAIPWRVSRQMCAARSPSRYDQMCLQSLRLASWLGRSLASAELLATQSLRLCVGPVVASAPQPLVSPTCGKSLWELVIIKQGPSHERTLKTEEGGSGHSAIRGLGSWTLSQVSYRRGFIPLTAETLEIIAGSGKR